MRTKDKNLGLRLHIGVGCRVSWGGWGSEGCASAPGRLPPPTPSAACALAAPFLSVFFNLFYILLFYYLLPNFIIYSSYTS